jgi:hypothetical protein
VEHFNPLILSVVRLMSCPASSAPVQPIQLLINTSFSCRHMHSATWLSMTFLFV